MSDTDAILQTLADWLAATGRKDAPAALAFLADDLVEFNLAPPLVAYPQTAKGLQMWFDTWAGDIALSMGEFIVEQAGHLAVAMGLIRMSGTKTDGKVEDVWYRGTFVLRRQGEGWRISHIHDSVPFYMDGSERAATDLKPRALRHQAKRP